MPTPEPGAAKALLTACCGQQPNFVWVYILRGIARGLLVDLSLADFRAVDAKLILQRAKLQAEVEYQFREAETDFAEALRLAQDEYVKYAVLSNRGFVRMVARPASTASAAAPRIRMNSEASRCSVGGSGRRPPGPTARPAAMTSL